MAEEYISSRNNPKIKAAAALLFSAGRKKSGRFLLEGARLCYDAVKNGYTPETLFITENAKEKYESEYLAVKEKAGNACVIEDHVAEKLSDTSGNQGFFCVMQQKEEAEFIFPDGFYVMTDNLQTPDNLGALSRTAEAFGVQGLIVNGGCDIYAPKALRASMGALLRLPVIKTKAGASLLRELKERKMQVYGAVLRDDALDVRTIEKSGGAVLVVGNEGNGISEEIMKECTSFVIIPMSGRAESLNAAAAAAILIWEFVR